MPLIYSSCCFLFKVMTLSIIIPTHKRADQAIRLLKSIAGQEFPYKALQALLISNLRDEKLRRQVPYLQSLFFDFKYKEMGAVGVNKARNMGLRFAGGDILYFLDDDCVLPNKSHLQNLVLEHERHPQAMGIGGGYKPMKSLCGPEKFYHEQSKKWMRELVSPNRETESLLGGNGSYKREVFDKGFYFDPLIDFGGSEESFNRALREQGWTLLYSEGLSVFHLIRLNPLSLMKKGFKQGAGLFNSRYKSGQTIESLKNIQEDWAFSFGRFSHYSFIYNLSFKLGYFWMAASLIYKKNILFRSLYFVFMLAKSRFYFLKKHFLIKYLGKLWFAIGWIYGRLLIKYLGKLWFAIGWIYGRLLIKYLGKLWFAIGWIYGRLLIKYLGKLWFAIGWIYGRLLIKYLGKLWFAIGWIYGRLLLPVFHHSPPMKIYYFSAYQYHKRIKPFLRKRALRKDSQ